MNINQSISHANLEENKLKYFITARLLRNPPQKNNFNKYRRMHFQRFSIFIILFKIFKLSAKNICVWPCQS